jgi:predicted DNA-binding protein (UPF0251 family)
MRIFIYQLNEMGKPEAIRWIGQTNNLKRRLKEHKRTRDNDNNPRKLAWIKSINKNIEIKVVEECDELNVDEREKWWIDYFKSQGHDLLNFQPGGRCARGYHRPKEANEKTSLALKGRKKSREHIENMRFSRLTPEHRERARLLGLSQKGRKHTKEEIQKQIQAQTGHLCSKETRIKIGNANRNRIISEEGRRRMSSSHIGKQTGENNPNSKLSEVQRNEIFELSEILHMKQKEIALKYNVSKSAIQQVIRKKRKALDKVT